ncbi:hypothetical protein [Streptosporangium sp. 'caverna']|nr:hypothetical protein [Streptosporangium sp. 'caverna']
MPGEDALLPGRSVGVAGLAENRVTDRQRDPLARFRSEVTLVLHCHPITG